MFWREPQREKARAAADERQGSGGELPCERAMPSRPDDVQRWLIERGDPAAERIEPRS